MAVFDRASKPGNRAIARAREIRAKTCNHVHISLKGAVVGACMHYCPVCRKNYRCGKGE